jgi:hypothetical protein
MEVLGKVSSSNVAAIAYAATTSTLIVEFKSGGLYQYAGVPAKVFAELKVAKSVGSFVSTRIRGQFSVKKVEDKSFKDLAGAQASRQGNKGRKKSVGVAKALRACKGKAVSLQFVV